MPSSGLPAYIDHRQANLADIMFALSVNFLLYVVLIIVFYMLVRFYLEEETSATPVGYHAVAMEDQEIELLQSTEEMAQTGVAAVAGVSVIPSAATPTDTTSTTSASTTAGVGVGEEKKLSRSSSATFLNMNEFNEPEGTKQEVIQRLIFCAAGLIVSFSIWGLVQERMLTQTYGGDYFVYSYGLVFMNRLGGLLFSAYLIYHFRIDWQPAVLWEYSFPSVANMLSSWCQYEALAYVSFPVVMLAKACKMIPIMLMGKIMNNKRYEAYEYLSGAAVTFGIYLFLSSSEHLDFFENVVGNAENITGAMCGVILLIFFLVFDSFTGQWQTRIMIVFGATAYRLSKKAEGKPLLRWKDSSERSVDCDDGSVGWTSLPCQASHIIFYYCHNTVPCSGHVNDGAIVVEMSCEES
eukprot:scaffold4399_cov175-Ochromonas_danica.AAC.16